jgi:4-hydroxy-tetrahydrodipicolinate synthase
MTLVKETIKATAGRTLVYAGISGNCLSESIDTAKSLHDLGVSVVVATMPCFYPVHESQMLKYFEELADRIPCPLIIYNIPATTHLSIPIAVIDTLSRHERIVGFKDSEKGIERIDLATTLWKHRTDFSYLLGWALQSTYAMKLGADGIVPSTGNLAPALYKIIVDAAFNGQQDICVKAQEKADAISRVYQEGRLLGHSLAALKAMLAAYGLCESYMLPPLYRLEAKDEKELAETTSSTFGNLNKINSIE